MLVSWVLHFASRSDQVITLGLSAQGATNTCNCAHKGKREYHRYEVQSSLLLLLQLLVLYVHCRKADVCRLQWSHNSQNEYAAICLLFTFIAASCSLMLAICNGHKTVKQTT